MLKTIVGFATISLFVLTEAVTSKCRCVSVMHGNTNWVIGNANISLQIPSDSCWPSTAEWNALNSSVSGQLIATQPLAIPCYPGPAHNQAQCALVDQQWTNASFQSSSPVGLSYPINITCPPVNVTAGQVPGTCNIGTNPRYAVNATSAKQVSAAVTFAKKHNVRLVIKNTGHDILGRSNGYGSLEIWIRHLRTGISFHESFQSSCSKTNWTGSAFTIGGGYTWTDIYPVAKQYNVVVVGGGTPSVGAIGGWMQGGGHGPASHQFGLGADQVLSAEVVLADGSVVTASPCENTDIYFAIRGGGPGTYGVVTSTTVKTHAMVSAAVQHLAIAPLTDSPKDVSAFLDAVSILFAAYPDLNDAGYAGYGSWSIASPAPLFGNFTAGFVHGIYMFNQSISSAQDAFGPTLKLLKPYNLTSLFISASYLSYPDYWTFYSTESGVEPPVGAASALGSRLFSRAAVKDHTSLRSMIQTLAGTAAEQTSNSVELVGGGQVFKDTASDPYLALNPAWRTAYFSNIVSRAWPMAAEEVLDSSVVDAAWHDITDVKTAAMKRQAPHTGAYMNEADRLDPDWETDFYGPGNYEKLLSIKNKRDPGGVFYCPTCVGSKGWQEDAAGRLCQV